MLQAFKTKLGLRKPPLDNTIQVTLSSRQLTQIINEQATYLYPKGHVFVRDYLQKIIHKKNSDLQKRLKGFIDRLNQERFYTYAVQEWTEMLLYDRDGVMGTVLQVWQPYLKAEIPHDPTVNLFLRRETYLMGQLVLRTILSMNDSLNTPSDKVHKKIRDGLDLRIIQCITEQHSWPGIMHTFVHSFGGIKGAVGSFTPSQISLTSNQFQSLNNFSKIPIPFNESQALILAFYKEHRIIQKVNLLVQAVNKVREQIAQYRSFFNLGPVTLSSDQIMPAVNYICECTNKDIFSSVKYVKALLSGEQGLSAMNCRDLLMEVHPLGDYCCQLVESVAGIHFHVSQLGETPRMPAAVKEELG